MGVTMLENDRPGSVAEVLARKVRMFRLVRQANGLSAALCEALYQCLKPAIYIYTKFAWWRYRKGGRASLFVKGNQLALHSHDKGVSIELAVYRVHEPKTSQLLEHALQSGMTVVDIGCNIGYFALLEAKCVGSEGKVIAIEPEPGNARLFQSNLRANGYRNVEFHQLAISNRNGNCALRISDKSNRHSLSSVPWRTTDLSVPVRTLDSLLVKNPPDSVDLVRMDLEGHEVEVLEGMRATIHRYSPKLLIEIHPDLIGTPRTVKWLGELQALGYRPDWVFDQERDMPLRWRFLRPETPTMDQLMADPRIHGEPKRPLMALFSRDMASRLSQFREETYDPWAAAIGAD
jgi:FkbM family methyltransferase